MSYPTPELAEAVRAWREVPATRRRAVLSELAYDARAAETTADEEIAEGLDGEAWREEAAAIWAALALLRAASEEVRRG